jgi:thioredoxin 1
MTYLIRSALALLLATFAILSFSSTTLKVHTADKSAYSDEITFHKNSWADIVKKAKAEQKLIFVDAYATWCGPCKLLKRTTFKDKKAAAFYNDNFISVAIDMETGEGPELANKWGLQVFPTLYVFDADGNMILVSEGYVNARDLILFGKAAQKKSSKAL